MENVSITNNVKAPLMMSIRKAAGIVPLSENAIRAGVKQGWVPGFYVGKKFLVNVDRLIEKLNESTGSSE